MRNYNFKDMVKRVLVIGLALTSVTASATPTIEGLLRGGSNPDNIFDWSVYRLRIKKEKALDFEVEAVDGEEESTEDSKLKTEVLAHSVKLIFSNHLDRPISFIQVSYSSPEMKKSQIIDIKSSKDLYKTLSKDTLHERSLFYGLLLGLSNGNSSIVSSLLKKFNKDYRSNKELLNKEKIDLYADYKKYLAVIKENPDLEKTLESPLRPVDVNKYASIKKILKQQMYQDLGQVNIHQEGDLFFWKAALENYEGVFIIDNHRLRRLSLTTPQGTITVGASKYRVFSSNFYLPGNLDFKDVLEETYKVEVRSYSQFGKNTVSFDTLLKRYTKEFDPISSILPPATPQLQSTEGQTSPSQLTEIIKEMKIIL